MKDNITLLGIDPGTSTLGLAIFHLNTELEIVKIETRCINTTKEKTKFRENANLEYRIAVIGHEIEAALTTYRPVGMAIEMPFINPRRIGSVIPLARLLGVLMDRSIQSNPYRMIYKKSPSEVKNAVGARGGADKDAVLAAVQNIKEISDLIKLEDLTDHEVDAIAINYGFLKSLRACYILPIL